MESLVRLATRLAAVGLVGCLVACGGEEPAEKPAAQPPAPAPPVAKQPQPPAPPAARPPHEQVVTMLDGGELPESYPDDFPVFPGSEGIVATEQKEGLAVVFSTDESLDDIHSFYGETLRGDGWTIEEETELPMARIIVATKGDRKTNILLLETNEGNQISVAFPVD